MNHLPPGRQVRRFATEESEATDAVETIAETVAADEATEEAVAADAIETVLETAAADEATEEDLAAEAVNEIAEKTMEANTEG